MTNNRQQRPFVPVAFTVPGSPNLRALLTQFDRGLSARRKADRRAQPCKLSRPNSENAGYGARAVRWIPDAPAGDGLPPSPAAFSCAVSLTTQLTPLFL